MQLLNVVLGGTLWQDLPSQRPGEVSHSQGKPYGAATHTVDLVPDTPLRELLGVDRIGVNTRHHQGVRDLAPSLAVCLPGQRFVWAVQWHPEHMAPEDANSERIFQTFLDACRA